MHLTLVGARFRPIASRECLANLSDGEDVLLVRDPANTYDVHAVQIHAVDSAGETHFIGFVAKEEAKLISAELDEAGGKASATVIDRPDHLSAILEYESAVS